MDAYWRAANYLSVGQIYLYDNPLLKRPLALARREAHAAWTLGHDPGPELHLRASESGHQEIRPRHDLRLRSGPRRSGGGRQHLSRGDVQRDLSEHQPGRSRAAKAIPAVLVSRRNSQPCIARVSGLDSRRRRARLFAQPFVRRGVRQSRADRRVRRRRWRGGNRARSPRRGIRTSFSIRVTDGAVLPILHLNGYKIANPTRPGAHHARGTGAVAARLWLDAVFRRGPRAGADASRPWPRRSTRRSSRSRRSSTRRASHGDLRVRAGR